MKKWLFVVICMGFSVGAAATQFDSQLALYNAGEEPTVDEMAGWHAGRCFYSQYGDPDTPYAGILFGLDHTSGKPAGDFKVMMGPPRDYALPADEFDAPTEDILNQLQDLVVDPYFDQLTKGEFKDGYYHSILNGFDRDYRVRVHVDKSNPDQPIRTLMTVGYVLSTGDIRFVCYHDKLLKNEHE
jgi:hypothetical protein